MRYLARQLEPVLAKDFGQFPAVVLTGPRRAGKTEILKHCFPDAAYCLLEDPDVLTRAKHDPRAFLDEQTARNTPVILDEIQNAPELLPYVRTRIDAAPRETGRWLITASQEFALMAGVNESLAGRAAILDLLPLSQTETPKVDMLTGGFPEVIAQPAARARWFSSYIRTCLERDVRAITQIRDLDIFARFMALLASRQAQVLNKNDLTTSLGITGPTIGQWLSILQTTGLLALIQPYFENFGKRLIKSPKIYWLDTGLVCHLLGIQTHAELERSPFLGALWEGHVATEILKTQINRGDRKQLYYFRDEQGMEVDFIVPAGNGRLHLIEAKATKTPMPAMAAPMKSLAKAMKDKVKSAWLVHRPAKTAVPTRALAPGVSAVTLSELVAEL